MKKHLLLGIAVILSGGCLHHSPYLYNHEVTITLKDRVPCFGLADDDEVRSEQVEIYSLIVAHHESSIPQKTMMLKFMNDAILRSGECVPYEGEMLENNRIYPISFSVRVANRHRNEIHGYGGSFCLSEKKNSEIILHHFKERERPTSCPVSSDE